MRKLKYILLTFLLVQSFFACENVDFGDTNQNVNGATEPATSGLLSGAIISFSTLTGRGGIMNPTLYVQYQVQVTYTDEMLYAQAPQSWAGYYTQPLNALNTIVKINSDEANHTPELMAQGFPANQIAVAQILKAAIMKRVTDIYGDVAYSEALKGLEDITPAYDSQEDIYKTLITEVKEARDMIDASELAPKGDLIYNGSLANWGRFANSLLLQMSLQLSKKYPGSAEYAATEFNLALNDAHGLITTVTQEAWFKYKDLVGFRNPIFANRTADYFLSREFTDAMKGNVTAYNRTSNHTFDNRLRVYARSATSATSNGVPYGYRDGSGASSAGAQMNRSYYWAAASPLPLMTSSYTYLNRAEAAALGWTTEDATTMLTNGIVSSYETLWNHVTVNKGSAPTQIQLTDGTAYAAARVADAGVVTGGILQVIREEKWVSLYGQAFDAWAEWRRTGVPDLLPATDYLNDGEIPRRYMYPSTEASLNGTNYTAGVASLSPASDENTAKVWWDQ